MKLATFEHNGGLAVGRVFEEDRQIEVFDIPSSLVAEAGVTALIGDDLPPVSAIVRLDEVKLLAPVPRPRRNVFCVGKNYLDHIAEIANSGLGTSSPQADSAQYPIIFSKVPESVTGPGMNIVIDPAVTTNVDYEAEVMLIIGKGGRNIRREDAMDHVWGYTICNDVSARDIQVQHTQWLLGKSQDSFCPMGPWAVTADEIDLADTNIKCWVNDELRQDSNTSHLIFDVPAIIEALSNGITLYPGDVVATGTPAGVGMGFKPPRFLQPGDKVKISVDGIGTLENPVAGF